VTSEASNEAGGAQCRWSERHRFSRGAGSCLSSPHAVAAVDSVALLVGQYLVGVMSGSRLVLERDGFLAASSHNTPKLHAVVGKDGERVSRSTDRNVELFAIDEFRRESGVDIDDDAVDRGALSRMGSRGVAMIDVTEAIERRA